MESNIKIVVDSSADTLELTGVPFACASLKIITEGKEYVDDARLDVDGMAQELREYKGRSSTACPGVGDWLTAFGDAEQVVCVTITSNLSGSYNAACIAKQDYEEQHPGRQVYVLDSLSAGPELRLILEKLREYVQAGLSFEEVCQSIQAYAKHTGLLFMLESMKNLANNGRVNPLIAKAAGLLGIRAVGKASDVGTLEMLEKSRGRDRALVAIVENMRRLGYSGGRVRISHCGNEQAANMLRTRLFAQFGQVPVEIYHAGGLCSFYAEQGGLLVGFEKGML
ncbi:MAG: DegV family protein [Clostridia bacterium]|nr:DegV family protein [Clostridia bacterium]